MNIGAALCAGIALWLLIPAPGLGLNRLVKKDKPKQRSISIWQIGILFCLVIGVLGVFSQPMAGLAVLAMIAITVGWLASSRLGTSQANKRSHQVVRAAQMLDSLLRLGHVPSRAIILAAEECTILTPVAVAVQLAGDPFQALEQMSHKPGQAGLADIGQAWRVSQECGAGMRDCLKQIRANLEETASTDAIITSELAGPRATAKILALLPLVGLLLAFGIGADPIQFLIQTLIGRVCLLAGVSLACLGVVWSEILARRVSNQTSRISVQGHL